MLRKGGFSSATLPYLLVLCYIMYILGLEGPPLALMSIFVALTTTMGISGSLFYLTYMAAIGQKLLFSEFAAF